jgi:CRP-like cAMP-binding protein
MLTTIEKVLILKGVSIFSGTPDEILAEVTSLLEEVDVPVGTTVFEKGDLGTCMYIIVDGRVRIVDGARVLNELGERDVFGEMAVLDRAPRMASVVAIEPTCLLRLDQDTLYELMADRVEVARGIIQVLSGRLRTLAHDLAENNSSFVTLRTGAT